jgi:hypothetical protein
MTAAVVVSASPAARDTHVFSLPITGTLGAAGRGTGTIADADRARAAALRAQAARAHTKRGGDNTPVINSLVTYTAAVGVGSPPTTCNSFL